MSFKFFLFIAFICTAACSTLDENNQFTQKPVSNDSATVYLYRPSSMSNAAYSPELLVNDEYKLSIKNGQYSSMTLPPGKTIFEIEPNKNYFGITEISLMLSAGKSYYIRTDTSLKLEASATYEPYQRHFNLSVIDEALAVSQIEKCCLTKKKTSTQQEPIHEVEKSSDEGFSVDKTQNPFSH